MAFFVINDKIGGPFPLCHLDLHYGNLLFDDDYNLTGVLDWSQAQTVPLERLAVCPEFITFPGAANEVNQAVVSFKDLTYEYLRDAEATQGLAAGSGKKATQTSLSSFFGTTRAEITYRCTYSSAHRALWDGKMVAGLIYGDAVPWEQLVAAYGYWKMQ
jgi:isoamyl acetate esterase